MSAGGTYPAVQVGEGDHPLEVETGEAERARPRGQGAIGIVSPPLVVAMAYAIFITRLVGRWREKYLDSGARASLSSARTMRSRCRTAGRRGQGLVELALAIPLMLLLMAGVVDLAHAFSVAGVIQNAAREGARWGATNATDTPGIQARAVEEAAGAPLAVSTSDVEVLYDNVTSNSGDPITVRVTHQMDLLLSFALGLPNPTIRRSASMVIF